MNALQRALGNRMMGRMVTADVRRLSRVLSTVTDSGDTGHVRWGDATLSTVAVPQAGDRPIVIEVMEYNLASALAKVDQVGAIMHNAARPTQARLAISIAFNQRAAANDYNDSGLTGGWTVARYNDVIQGCQQIATRMDQRGVLGAAFPAIWSPTEGTGGYTFPFLELRARSTLHAGTLKLVELLSNVVTEGEVIVRGMDADVSNDPLLTDVLQDPNDALGEIARSELTVLSGGYNWDTQAKPPAFWGATAVTDDVTRWNNRWTQILTQLNRHEHHFRSQLLNKGGASLLYWPEPNIYMSASKRQAGAEAALAAVKPRSVQMRESVFYLRKPAREGTLTGAYDKGMTTTKPAKSDYFSELRDLIKAADTKTPSVDEIGTVLSNIRQAHFSPSHVEDIQKAEWYGVQHPMSKDVTESGRATFVTSLATRVRQILTT